MQRLAMDLRVLSRELALYLEHQVRVGFFGSGVGLSLILGFSVAYACYYLSSIAKVSRGRGRRSVAGPGAAPRARGRHQPPAAAQGPATRSSRRPVPRTGQPSCGTSGRTPGAQFACPPGCH